MEINIWTEVITIKHTKINIAIIITTLYVNWYVSNKSYRCLDNDDVCDELGGEEERASELGDQVCLEECVWILEKRGRFPIHFTAHSCHSFVSHLLHRLCCCPFISTLLQNTVIYSTSPLTSPSQIILMKTEFPLSSLPQPQNPLL